MTQTNGQCERFNSTLFGMLGTLPREEVRVEEPHWNIGSCLQLQNSATGFSPYYLMYGRQPHLLIDVTLLLPPWTTTGQTTSKFCTKYVRTCKMGPRKRLKPSKSKRPNIIKRTMTNKAKQWPWRLGTWF